MVSSGTGCVVTRGQTSPGVRRREKRVALSGIDTETCRGPAGNEAGSVGFSCLEDLLTHHARRAPGRHAILAPGRAPLTYGALRSRANEMVRELRSFGVGRNDRVAVGLANRAETRGGNITGAVRGGRLAGSPGV